MKRVLNLTLAMTFATGLALAGCGDDDPSGDGGTDAATSGTGGRGGSGGSGGKAGTGGRSGSSGKGGAGGKAGSAADDGGVDENDGGTTGELSFFVTSKTSMTGDLGGLDGADKTCNDLAKAAGSSAKFAAYLSTETVNARDRIGKGPWYNAKGALVAKDLDALHKLPSGDVDLFLTEKGDEINGQWEGSPTPNEHDILTGSNADGTLMAGKTCEGWTSDASDKAARVGHSDGLGPMRNPNPPYNSWNSSHDNESCANTTPRGGAGRFYCFAVE